MEQRRETLCLKFARKCHKNTQTNDNCEKKDTNHIMELRNTEVYKVNRANTERYKSSSVPYMQRLLNKYEGNENNHSWVSTYPYPTCKQWNLTCVLASLVHMFTHWQ